MFISKRELESLQRQIDDNHRFATDRFWELRNSIDSLMRYLDLEVVQIPETKKIRKKNND